MTEYREHYFHFPQTELEDESYPFRCRLCIRVFKRRDIFELHLRRHLDTDQECPYVCVICNTKTFQKHSQMKKHQKNCTESRELPEAVRNLYEQHGLHGATVVQFVCSCGKQSTQRHSHQERTYLLVHFSSYILFKLSKIDSTVIGQKINVNQSQKTKQLTALMIFVIGCFFTYDQNNSNSSNWCSKKQ